MKTFDIRKAAGLCFLCKGPIDSPHVVCAECRKARRDLETRLKNAGICLICRKRPVKSKTLCVECLTQKKDRSTSDRIRRKAAGTCRDCSKPTRPGLAQCEVCAIDHNTRQRARHGLLKAKALALYGGRCCCCGEAESSFLQFDHVNNDGASERRSIPAVTLIHRLSRLSVSDSRYQLLCSNCNYSKELDRRAGGAGICVHQLREIRSQP